MANFVYLIGDPVKRECVLVDPAWDVDSVVDLAEKDGYRVTGGLVTHWLNVTYKIIKHPFKLYIQSNLGF